MIKIIYLLSSNIFSKDGFIKDSSNGEPIAYSNTTIAHSETKGILKGTASDINGYFIITNLLQGEYQINISIIGYKLYSDNIIIVNDNIELKKIYYTYHNLLSGLPNQQFLLCLGQPFQICNL